MTDTHYFSEQPSGAEHRRTITASVWGQDLTMITANGVFAGDGLDRGTAVLLRESPVPPGKPRILDLGCGYGTIALALALHSPGAVIDAVDINDRALALCRDNAVALGVADRIHVLRPDEADPAARYDEIWSNPPIRIGKPALQALLLRWLPRLAPDWRGPAGGRQEPRRRHPAALADRPGLPLRTPRLGQGLPGAPGPSRLTPAIPPRPHSHPDPVPSSPTCPVAPHL